MRGAIFHSPNTPSWRGTQLKHREFYLLYIVAVVVVVVVVVVVIIIWKTSRESNTLETRKF
jgi:heme/copper-type cytochrome/quinol oxidase subunit 2